MTLTLAERHILGLTIDEPLVLEEHGLEAASKYLFNYDFRGAEEPEGSGVLDADERRLAFPVGSETFVAEWRATGPVLEMTGPKEDFHWIGDEVDYAGGQLRCFAGKDRALVLWRKRLLIELRTDGRVFWAERTARDPFELIDHDESYLAPGLDALAPSLDVQLWLRVTFGKLAGSLSSVDRAAAAGLVGRLATPSNATRHGQSWLDAWLRGDSPRSRVVKWWKSIPLDIRMMVERSAASESDELGERLHQLEEWLVEREAEASGVALSWLHRRDDLESVAFLARSDGRAELLERALERLDRRALTFHSMWVFARGLELDPRLRAVSWQEPADWWGVLATTPPPARPSSDEPAPLALPRKAPTPRQAARHRWSEAEIEETIEICLRHPPGPARRRAAAELADRLGRDPSNPISLSAVVSAIKAADNAIDGIIDRRPKPSRTLSRLVDSRRAATTLVRLWSSRT